jgi:hypothetical protein
MARNKAKRQKKLMRKRQKDKLRKKRQVESIPYAVLSTKKKIHLARHYPLYECLINPSWEEKGLATIVVSRRQPDGDLIFGVYLVDILCLGLKNTFCNADFPLSRYSTELVDGVYRDEDPIECLPDMAHQIIYGAIAFARRFGFHPHRDFDLSQYVLEESGSLEEAPQIEFGRDGKPFYVSGPDDNVPRILRQLKSTAGQGHFDYMCGGPDPDPYLPDCPGQTFREIK